MSTRNIRSLLLFPLLLIIVTVLPIIFWKELVTLFSSGKVLQEFVDDLGIWAVLGFIGVQMTQVVFFIIPGNILQASAGYLFNLPLGTLYSLIGISIGTMINYFLGYKLGTPFVKRFVKEDTYRTISSMANSFNALMAMFIFFLIPGVPKDLAVFVAGSVRINFRAFQIVSLVGRTPMVIGSVAFGTSISNEQWVLAIVIGAIAVVGFAIGLIFRKPIQQRLLKNS